MSQKHKKQKNLVQNISGQSNAKKSKIDDFYDSSDATSPLEKQIEDILTGKNIKNSKNKGDEDIVIYQTREKSDVFDTHASKNDSNVKTKQSSLNKSYLSKPPKIKAK